MSEVALGIESVSLEAKRLSKELNRGAIVARSDSRPGETIDASGDAFRGRISTFGDRARRAAPLPRLRDLVEIAIRVAEERPDPTARGSEDLGRELHTIRFELRPGFSHVLYVKRDHRPLPSAGITVSWTEDLETLPSWKHPDCQLAARVKLDQPHAEDLSEKL